MRSNRKYSTTGLYHIVIRGVNKQNIFLDDSDKNYFIFLLKKYGKNFKIKLHAFCLMSNHVHLQIEDMETNISKYMQTINSIYARFFNKKYDRIGHLFQNRYLSECIEDEFYYKQVFRYILRNPVNAGIKKLNNYKWSSYSLYKKGSNLIDSKFPIKIFETLNLLYQYVNKNSEGEFLDIELRPSETESLLINKIKKLLNTNTTLIKPDLPMQEIIKKVKKLKSANIPLRSISRLTGIMYWIVAKA